MGDFKLLYAASCILLGLVILAPTVALVVRLPEGERFSELYVLGPGHMAEGYPFNVSVNSVYRVFLGVGNHMGGLEDYVVYVKFRNQTESLHGDVDESLFEYRVALRDSDVWEREVSFSFSERERALVVDGYSVAVEKIVAWNNQTSGFYCQLLFELWHFDGVSAFEYHNRFIGLWLNVTVPT